MKCKKEEFWKIYSIKDEIFNASAAWYDFQMPNLKYEWKNLWSEANDCEYMETKNVSVMEIAQLSNVAEWLEYELDVDYDVLNDKEITSCVNDIEEEIDEDEFYILSVKTALRHISNVIKMRWVLSFI